MTLDLYVFVLLFILNEQGLFPNVNDLIIHIILYIDKNYMTISIFRISISTLH